MASLYFAYGHNTNTKEMLKRIPEALLVGSAELPDYQLMFYKFAGVEKKLGAKVKGVVWLLPNQTIPKLDYVEGLGIDYKKKVHDVFPLDSSHPVQAFVYEQLSKPLVMPPKHYVRWLKKGYAEHGLPQRQINDALSRASRASATLKRANPRRSYSRRG
jgi:gamma-glutamylcyclotransferase (GGCT)/AIG2-like uncharacterized protein YtfP